MSNWWKYAAIGAGTFFIGGAAGVTGGGIVGHKRGYEVGYKQGYDESEPEITIYGYKQHGYEGLCVEKNSRQRVCAYDANSDGAVDIVLYEDGKVKEVKWGEEKCLLPVKSLEQLSEEPTQKE
ncbi:MAG: hypothetical protein Q8R47_02775 [Nanoarchaeota archaeon]|nr:hypothetical protein [Nanoarchaeota archaeon]